MIGLPNWLLTEWSAGGVTRRSCVHVPSMSSSHLYSPVLPPRPATHPPVLLIAHPHPLTPPIVPEVLVSLIHQPLLPLVVVEVLVNPVPQPLLPPAVPEVLVNLVCLMVLIDVAEYLVRYTHPHPLLLLVVVEYLFRPAPHLLLHPLPIAL